MIKFLKNFASMDCYHISSQVFQFDKRHRFIFIEAKPIQNRTISVHYSYSTTGTFKNYFQKWFLFQHKISLLNKQLLRYPDWFTRPTNSVDATEMMNFLNVKMFPFIVSTMRIATSTFGLGKWIDELINKSSPTYCTRFSGKAFSQM